jgi:membrane fusion protein, multidrug efflux system
MAAEEGSEHGAEDGGSPTKDPRSYTAESEDSPNSGKGAEKGKGKGDDSDKGGDGKDGDKGRGKRKGPNPITLVILSLVVVILLVLGIIYWLHARQFQSTDDAFVDTHLVRLAPRISGRVEEVLVEDNQNVSAGQVVIRIDSRDQQASLDQAQAQKAQAEAQIAQAQATLDQNAAQVRVAEATYTQNLAQAASSAAQATNAARDLVRYQTLKGVNPVAVSQQQLDQAQSQAQSTAANRDAALRQADAARRQIAATQAQAGTARAQIAAGQAQVAAADAQIRSAQLQLSYTDVKAPEAGTVAQRSVAIGNYVNAGAQIMAIVPLRTWITANFKETQLAHMRAGQPATVHVDACPDADLNGHVDSIQHGSGQAFGLLPPENATGNFVKVVQRVPVKILIDHTPPDCPLGPGLSVEPKVKVR